MNYVFWLSVHLSIRPNPAITSFHLYMGPLVHSTNRDLFAACPSVCPSGEVSGHLLEKTWREWFEILHVDISWAPSVLIRLWSRYFDLVKWVKFGVSGHFLENAWWEWPEILHADVSRPSSEMICLWSWSVDLSNFGTILNW